MAKIAPLGRRLIFRPVLLTIVASPRSPKRGVVRLCRGKFIAYCKMSGLDLSKYSPKLPQMNNVFWAFGVGDLAGDAGQDIPVALLRVKARSTSVKVTKMINISGPGWKALPNGCALP